MKHQFSTHLGQPANESHAELLERIKRRSVASNKRIDSRCELAAQAFVAVPSLKSRAYEVLEISRSGMFLAFRDAKSTREEFERHSIEPGTSVEVAFSAPLTEGRHRFSVRASIARITRQGIGVQFATRNPPQLAALRELFPDASEDKASENSQERVSHRAPERKLQLKRPPDTSGWLDWELED